MLNDPTTFSRFWSKVSIGDDCWLWQGAKDTCGYGNFNLSGQYWKSHRLAYTFFRGPITEGFELDHLCKTRNCVRPSHMEPVTHRVNVLRGECFSAKNAQKTHCPQGHPYSGDNLYINPSSGGRCCKSCNVNRNR